MESGAGSGRDVILARVRAALSDAERAPVSVMPLSAAGVPARVSGDPAAEVERLLAEVRSLAGHGLRIAGPMELAGALAGLVREEGVRRATAWATPEIEALGITRLLAELGVEMVPPGAPARDLATCDLGITGVDAALPETGTLVLRTTRFQPQGVSLLPRAHLAVFRPAVLCGDLGEALDRVKHDPHAVLITGPSRTADIEKTLAIGMHGPKSLHVWCYEG